MTIKSIEFTNDIEKPHLSPSRNNSLKRSKYTDSKPENKDDGIDLIRRRLSSDDEEYQIRKQNAAADMTEREQAIAENQCAMDESKQKRMELRKMHKQQKESNVSFQSNGNHYKPNPPNRKSSLPLKRRPIPIGTHIKQNSNNENLKQSPKFKPQPPGSPKEPILPSNSINDKQSKDDSLIYMKNFDYYSYSSYAESMDTDSSSSENNFNLRCPSNNNNNNDSNSGKVPNANPNNSEINTTNDQTTDTNANVNQPMKQNINESIESPANSLTKKVFSEKYFYRLEKTTASRIPKKKKKYTFFLGNTVLVEVIFSKKQKNIQFKAFDAKSQSEKLYTLLIGNQKSSFSLRNGTIYDNEIFSMRIVDEKRQFHYQSVFLNSFVNMQDFPNKLVNRSLDMDMESPESPLIIFGKRGQDIIPSKSNWIFYSSEDEELIAVMRGSKSTIFIESVPIVITPIIFTIALVAFIGHPDKV